MNFLTILPLNVLFTITVLKCVEQVESFSYRYHQPLFTQKRTETFLTSLNLVSNNISSKRLNQIPSESTETLDWSFIDKVYLITCPNADKGSQRLTKTKEILSKVQLLDKVEIKEFDTDDDDRVRGCYASHIKVLQDAMDFCRGGVISDKNEENWLQSFLSLIRDGLGQEKYSHDTSSRKRILVLEDNLEANGKLEKKNLESISKFLDSNNEVDMIHLAYIPFVPNLIVTSTEDKSVVKLNCGVGSALGTTAYIINESAIEKILKEDSRKGYYCAIPDMMALLFPDTRYCAFPTPFLRAPKIPSLVNPQLDDLRAMLFQPPVVSLVQNLLAYTQVSSNNLFFCTISLLLTTATLAGKITLDAAHQIVTNGSYDGNIALPFISSLFSVLCLAVLAQGVILAPSPPEVLEDEEIEAKLNMMTF